MKHNLLYLICFFTTVTCAQFYASGSGGYAVGTVNMLMGKIETETYEEAVYGSYGEGFNTQLRFGYYFDKTFGVDIGFGYLHGADITQRDIKLPSLGQELYIKGRGKAFGIMPTLVYRYNDNLYGRIGPLIKVGGKTEVIGNAKAFLPANTLQNVSANSTLDVEFVRDFKGKVPLGFTAAIGYKYHLNKKLSVFIEAEYFGISVRRDKATLEDFNAILDIEGIGKQELTNHELIAAINNSSILSSDSNIQTLSILISDETNYVDSRNKTDNSFLAETVPYSSFGINFGFTYTFGK
ncbi:outer membrane beta-barrel protein [Tenacibaculum sp. IB213877]|uniref:outer membrane beta-barrel protein n=1 Tax=Tenacibaculum sp. IB213877 TaxID=3097351 RepID=UPI002A59D9D1|nr:outer membrane beta-barrel protein [Tenacibaculum sp. IB213877]MDY0779840.1 outer membrane beta-barrel protein [Tenacibaculum sp. IB213877]